MLSLAWSSVPTSHAAVLQAAHGARQIGDHQVGHGVGGAAGHTLDGAVQAHRAVSRRDHRVHAGRVGRAQAGAQVVRIGHAVQDQQQRRPFDHIEHFIDVHRQLAFFGQRHHALVAGAARQAVQALHADRMQAAAGALGLLDERLHALVAARRFYVISLIESGAWRSRATTA